MPEPYFFAEGNFDWTSTPEWAEFLISLGHAWPLDLSTRRLGLVSFPCDSAAAGLVTLGALIRDLENPNANDVAGHYDALARHAQQYLTSCRDCEVDPCDPSIKKCGYITKASGKVRSVRYPRKVFVVSNRTNLGQRELAFAYNDLIEFPKPQFATDWHLDNDPPPVLANGEGELSVDAYRYFFPEQNIFRENLRRTYSGLCLAGRASGETATRTVMANIRFRHASEYRLDDLLTIMGWSDAAVSRVTFFNVRTGTFDRRADDAALVVADGHTSFLNAAGRSEFQNSDIIGVFNRSIERDALETLGNKLQAWRQWYQPDNDLLSRISPLPRGISLMILRRQMAV